MNADHRHWISALIRYLLTQLDRADVISSAGGFTENVTKDVAEDVTEDVAEDVTENAAENEPGTRPLEIISLSEVEPNFYLGAKQSKPLVIKSLQTHGAAFDQAFTSFRSRVSIAINEMSHQPTNVVDESQEVC